MDYTDLVTAALQSVPGVVAPRRETPHRTRYPGQIDVTRPGDPQHRADAPVRIVGMDDPVSAEEAREIAVGLLAAADRAEADTRSRGTR